MVKSLGRPCCRNRLSWGGHPSRIINCDLVPLLISLWLPEGSRFYKAAPRPPLKPPLESSALCLAGLGLKFSWSTCHLVRNGGARCWVRALWMGRNIYYSAAFSPAGLGLLSALPGHNAIYSTPFFPNYKTFQQSWRIKFFYIWLNLYNRIIIFIIWTKYH